MLFNHGSFDSDSLLPVIFFSFQQLLLLHNVHFHSLTFFPKTFLFHNATNDQSLWLSVKTNSYITGCLLIQTRVKDKLKTDEQKLYINSSIHSYTLCFFIKIIIS